MLAMKRCGNEPVTCLALAMKGQAGKKLATKVRVMKDPRTKTWINKTYPGWLIQQGHSALM
jgi:hypothetical protein